MSCLSLHYLESGEIELRCGCAVMTWGCPNKKSLLLWYKLIVLLFVDLTPNHINDITLHSTATSLMFVVLLFPSQTTVTEHIFSLGTFFEAIEYCWVRELLSTRISTWFDSSPVEQGEPYIFFVHLAPSPTIWCMHPWHLILERHHSSSPFHMGHFILCLCCTMSQGNGVT